MDPFRILSVNGIWRHDSSVRPGTVIRMHVSYFRPVLFQFINGIQRNNSSLHPMFCHWLSEDGVSLIEQILLGFVHSVTFVCVTHPFVLFSVIYRHLSVYQWNPEASTIPLSRPQSFMERFGIGFIWSMAGGNILIPSSCSWYWLNRIFQNVTRYYLEAWLYLLSILDHWLNGIF